MQLRPKETRTGGDHEFCPTPRWPIARWVEESGFPPHLFRPGARWCEPHAGKGAIIRAINSIFPGIIWTACEIRSEARDDLVKLVGAENVFMGDFSQTAKSMLAEITEGKRQPFDVILTNPAFSLASRVRDDALTLTRYLALLLPTSYLGSAERQPKHKVFMPSAQKILPDRPSFTESGETDSRDYAIFEWTPACGPVCMTTVLGITPIEERKRDHEALFDFLLPGQQLGLFESLSATVATETNRRPETTHDMSKPAIGMTYNQAQNVNLGECPNNGPSCDCNACVMCESLTCTCGCKMIDHHSDGEGCTTCQTCPVFILAAWKNGPVIGSCKGPWGTHRKHGEVCNDCAFPMIADATQAGWSDKPVMSPITTPPDPPRERCIIPPHEAPPAPSADVPPQAPAEAPKRKRRTKAAKPQDAPTVAAQPPAPPTPVKEEPPPKLEAQDKPKQETPVSTGLMGALAKQFPGAFAPEIIDGSDVEKTAADVMLDVAFSPVLPFKNARYPAQVSELYGGKYRVYFHREEPAPFAHMTGTNELDVSANELKVMRARYLLRRGELSKLLHAMEPHQREHWQKIYNISFVPAFGSTLHDLITGATTNPITIPLKPGENPLKAMGELLVEAGANPDEIRIIGTDDEDQVRSVSYAALPTSIAITQDDLDAKAAAVERAQKAVQDDDTAENRKALRDAETELDAWQQVHAEQQASLPTWIWGEASASLNRTGMARYTHIVRAADDPERTDIRALPEHLRDREAKWRKGIKDTPPATYKPLILALLADGLPRTFNRIGVELLDKTADNLLDLPPDKALWELVHEGRVEHTTKSPILFRRRNRKDRTKEEVAEDVRVTLAALESALDEGETVTVEVLQDMLVEEHDEVRTWAECMVLWKQSDRSNPPPAKPTYFATWVDKPKPPFMVDANTAKDPCRPGAWGDPSRCINHEGQPLDENGLCFWGRKASPLEQAVRSAFMDHDEPPEGFSRIHDDGDTVIFMGPTIDLRDLSCDITPGCVVGKNHMGRCTTNKNETCTQCGIACVDHSDSPTGGSCKDCKKGCVRKRFSVMTEVWIRDLAQINSDLADARWKFAEARVEYEEKRTLENAEVLDKTLTRIRHLTTNQTLIAAQLEGPHARAR